jgi:phenylalanyl-tRNA synthetase beta chain
MECIGAGRRVGSVIDRYPSPRGPRTIALRRPRIELVLGMCVPDEEVQRIFTSLGLTVGPAPDGWSVRVPTFRVDLLREIDLVEEVGRHHGFDRLEPAFPPMTSAAPAPDRRVPRDRLVRAVAAAAGLTEAVTFGFIEREAAHLFVPDSEHENALAGIANPLSAKFDVLRPSLLPGLIDAVAHNRRHGRRDVAVFEVGARFTTTVGERRGVALAWTGAAAPEHWSGSGREVDFFDVKGVVEQLCAALEVPVRCEPADVSGFVAGQSAQVLADGTRVGVLGLVAPKIVESRGAPRHDKVFAAELDLDALAAGRRRGDELVRPLPRYPSVVRDLSVIVSERLSAESIRGTIQAAATQGAAPLASVAFFDRYKGKGVADDAVSLSVRLTFQAPDRTLTDADVQQSFDSILSALVREHGAVQR